MEGFFMSLQKLCRTRMRRLVLVLGMLACTFLVFHSFTLPSSNISSPTFPTTENAARSPREIMMDGSSGLPIRVGELSLLSDPANLSSANLKEVMNTDPSENKGGYNNVAKNNRMSNKEDDGNDLDDDSDWDGDGDPDSEFAFDIGNGFVMKKVRDPVDGFITLVKVKETNDVSLIQEGKEGHDLTTASTNGYVVGSKDFGQLNNSLDNYPVDGWQSIQANSLQGNNNIQEKDLNLSSGVIGLVSGNSSLKKFTDGIHPKNNDKLITESIMTTSNFSSSASAVYSIPKKKRRIVPRKSISEMNDILRKTRASHRTLKPRWSSVRDQQMFRIRSQIDHSPLVKNVKELHAPAFRNISMFMRSYELMERTLKVYVYKEGKKPIFHQPLLRGIYASEGWFMKLMEGNRKFIVNDPRKAHLFYMPFSSRFLEFSLYVPGSHNRTNLRAYLQSYIDMIARKYSFWNRTSGTDHFLVACHDWAPYETKHTMERSIRALCNAELSGDFRLGKDMSLPETYVRSGRNPLRDLGGKPAKERSIFAFYAGNMHGYLRPILLQHWENKDPEMKILGPMPPGVKSKMTYIQHMKNSKYCICPRGYEVNSPRVVEAIFYECVPVIISDNYIPPFFEVLNWEEFAVFIAEADIPRLKEILKAIPEEKFLSLQTGVRKVQQHFLWHIKPVKYDLFHMILHSIWYNRVYTIRPR